MLFLEKLYSDLYDKKRIAKLESKTNAFYFFNSNLGRALVLPTLVYGPDSDTDWAYTDSTFLCQAAITQIITSLETYYQNILRTIANIVKITEVDARALSSFLKKNRLLTEFTRALESQETLNFPLLELIPEFFPLQQKDKIKVAMNLIDLDPVGTCHSEWSRTFGNTETSTVKLRHSFVHEGLDYTASARIGLFRENFITERIKDAIVLVCHMEPQLSKKYKEIEELYPKRAEPSKKEKEKVS